MMARMVRIFLPQLRRHTDDSAVANAKELDSPRAIREPRSMIAQSMLLVNRNREINS